MSISGLMSSVMQDMQKDIQRMMVNQMKKSVAQNYNSINPNNPNSFEYKSTMVEDYREMQNSQKIEDYLNNKDSSNEITSLTENKFDLPKIEDMIEEVSKGTDLTFMMAGKQFQQHMDNQVEKMLNGFF